MTGRAIRAAAVVCCLTAFPGLRAQQLKPETIHGFDCYVQSAEARMEARKQFLFTNSSPGQKVQTMPANGSNPHAVPGGQLYDLVGLVFIPGVTLEQTLRMLQDYDHRVRYFPEILSSSKLLCRTGEGHFGFTMQLKEPAVIETQNDVVWERVDATRWRCRSYSTGVREIGKNHGYLQRLNSYWRFVEAGGGVTVESETLTLSGEFSSAARMLGSMMGINPEKSLRRTLESMRTSLLNKGLQVPAAPVGIPECGEAFHPAACDGR